MPFYLGNSFFELFHLGLVGSLPIIHSYVKLNYIFAQKLLKNFLWHLLHTRFSQCSQLVNRNPKGVTEGCHKVP